MTTVNSTDCETMLTYSKSVELRLSLLINWFIMLPSFPIIGYSFFYCWTRRLFHKNTQLQVIIHLGGLLVHCFGRFSLHTLDLFNYFHPHTDGCDILPNFYRCLILRFFYNSGQALVSMTPVSIILERLIAVGYNRAYENCSINYGVLLGALQIALAIAYLTTRYIHAAFRPASFTFFYCQTLVSSTISTNETYIPLLLIIVSHIISILTFRCLEMKNKKLREVVDINLSTRYTLDQGRRSFIALKCFISYNCLMVSLITAGLMFLHLVSSHFSKPNYMAIIEMTHAIPLYGMIVCVAVYWKLRTIDGEQRRNITLALRGQAVHTDLYFQMFEKQLN